MVRRKKHILSNARNEEKTNVEIFLEKRKEKTNVYNPTKPNVAWRQFEDEKEDIMDKFTDGAICR